MRAFLANTRKAIGVASTLLAAWATAIIDSASGPITAKEWALLIPIGLAVLACYGLTNDPPVAAPEPERVELLGVFPGKP